jgi:hypothetical protein
MLESALITFMSNYTNRIIAYLWRIDNCTETIYREHSQVRNAAFNNPDISRMIIMSAN